MNCTIIFNSSYPENSEPAITNGKTQPLKREKFQRQQR
ncbi:MAG: hypothetical protein OFPI_24670 [Osedax symbiont Rs2]|nr:MAG: hypothetical protein OFPI_24670 [Osedax symbiont Rs2]